MMGAGADEILINLNSDSECNGQSKSSSYDNEETACFHT
jgi:hypothetical protein